LPTKKEKQEEKDGRGLRQRREINRTDGKIKNRPKIYPADCKELDLRKTGFGGLRARRKRIQKSFKKNELMSSYNEFARLAIVQFQGKKEGSGVRRDIVCKGRGGIIYNVRTAELKKRP